MIPSSLHDFVIFLCGAISGAMGWLTGTRVYCGRDWREPAMLSALGALMAAAWSGWL